MLQLAWGRISLPCMSINHSDIVKMRHVRFHPPRLGLQQLLKSGTLLVCGTKIALNLLGTPTKCQVYDLYQVHYAEHAALLLNAYS